MRSVALLALLLAGCPTARLASDGGPDAPTDGRPDARCGDGILDLGESCDDGNTVSGDACAADCTFPTCVSGADCPDEAPSCSERLPDGTTLRCRPLGAGGAIGEACASDDDCATGWCDLPQGRCTWGCVGDADCGFRQGWCAGNHRFLAPGISPVARCAAGCDFTAECPEGSVCRPGIHFEEWGEWAHTLCTLPAGPGRFGDSCTVDSECASGMCEASNTMRGQRCSDACFAAGSCGDDLLHMCVRLGTVAPPRPPGWDRPYWHFCSGRYTEDTAF